MEDKSNETPVVTCADCGQSWFLHDEPMFDADDDEGVFCIECAENAAEKMRPEFEAWAREDVKLTAEPHVFDPRYRWAPTPEEYEAGDRQAYTQNSVAAFNRHLCTNYDELIADLDWFDPRDRAAYIAIRERADELVDERVEAIADQELDELLDDPDPEMDPASEPGLPTDDM